MLPRKCQRPTLAAQGCLDVVLVCSPDRLARKFVCPALLIEELARCGVRVEFVKGPRGDSPEDQLLIQFQGMLAEYEKAQLAERYRRGKAWRAKAGRVNVLGGAPFGYRYVRKTPECGARYEVVPHEAGHPGQGGPPRNRAAPVRAVTPGVRVRHSAPRLQASPRGSSAQRT
jgi:hypothetical protein